MTFEQGVSLRKIIFPKNKKIKQRIFQKTAGYITLDAPSLAGKSS